MPSSRRRTLALLAAACVPLAGCNGDATGVDATPTPTPTEPAGGPGDDGTSYGDRSLPPYGYLRSNEHATVASREDRPTRDDDAHYPGSFLVDSQEHASEIEYRDVDGVGAVRAFVDETDFDAAAVFVDQRSIQACYRLELCSISWTETSIDMSLERVPFPYDVACDADAQAVEARFVRIPDPLDRDDVTSWGSSTGSGGCPNAPGPVVGGDVPGTNGSTGNGTGTRGSTATKETRTNGARPASLPRSTTGDER